MDERLKSMGAGVIQDALREANFGEKVRAAAAEDAARRKNQDMCSVPHCPHPVVFRGLMRGRHGEFPVRFCENDKPKYEASFQLIEKTDQELRPYEYPAEVVQKELDRWSKELFDLMNNHCNVVPGPGPTSPILAEKK